MMKAGADADSTAVADSDSLAPSVLSSVFGKIPAIYEAEMLAITEQARQESGNNAQAMRGIMANLADSAYKVAEEKSLHEIVSMQGAIVRCSADEGLPYTIAPEAHVLTTLRPELTNVGGAQRVFVQMEVKSDSITKRAYYVLRGKEGDVAVGSMNLPLSTQQEKTVAVIVAPNAPARYLRDTFRQSGHLQPTAPKGETTTEGVARGICQGTRLGDHQRIMIALDTH